MSGSIIGCEEQTLGEVLDVSGTPFTLHYQSQNVPGRLAANRIRIRLSGDELPASVVKIHLVVEVAGQVTYRTYAPEPNLVDVYEWTGRDVFFRRLQGRQLASIRVPSSDPTATP